MTTLQTIDLQLVTGGKKQAAPAFSVCARFDNLTVAKAKPMDLAIANRFCSVGLPTEADKEHARHIMFATGGAQ